MSTSSSDETKDQIDLLNCKDNQHLLFTNSSVILTSEDEGLGHDHHSRGLYRSEEDSGPSSLEHNEKKSKINKNELNSNKQDRSTSPLMNVDELEQQLYKLEEHNNELIEQNLELEEAENDSRLVSQKLKVKVDNLLEQIDNLQVNLEQSQEYIKENETKLNESKNREEQLMEQIKDLQTKLEEERNISSLSTINSSDDCWPESNCKSSTNLDNFNDYSSANDSPICNSIKPIKIDLCNQNSQNNLYTNNDQLDSLNEQILKLNETKENSNRLNEQSVNQNLKALENNYKQMNDRLKHLQSVNTVFVKDLEQREHLLTRKELLFREWITKEIILKRSLAELNNELDELNKQFSQSQRMRADLRTKCEELHQQLTELETNDNELLSVRQKEVHELISNYKQQEYDHRLIELLNKFKMQFDVHCTKEMEKEEQTQIVLDKLCLQEQELNEKMRKLMNKQNELKDQIYKQQKNLEKVSESFWTF